MHAARGRVLLCAVLGLVGSVVLPVSHAGAAVPSMHDRDVLPPGQGGDIPTNQYSTDQIPLYSGLTPLAGNVTPNDIQTYFKDDPIGSTDGKPEYVPIAGLRILPRQLRRAAHLRPDTGGDGVRCGLGRRRGPRIHPPGDPRARRGRRAGRPRDRRARIGHEPAAVRRVRGDEEVLGVRAEHRGLLWPRSAGRRSRT